MGVEVQELRAWRIKAGAPPRRCEVQPHGAFPDGCHASATHELRMMGGQSFLCAVHFDFVRKKLDALAAEMRAVMPGEETP